MGLITPEPGWVAAKLMPAGSPVAIALLGVAITLNDAKAGDEEINDWFDQFVRSTDPIWEINQHYVALEQQYPFLLGYLEPITKWTENPSLSQANTAQAVAEHLRNICWSEFEGHAGGDILGRVYNQMESIGAVRTVVFDYSSIEDAYQGMIERGYFLKPLRSFVDAWCGSGCRVIAAVRVQKDFGHPGDFPVRLNDPRPAAVAMAGLNMVCYDITHDTKLMCDTEWADMWGATSFMASSPHYLRQLPPELAIDAPKAFKGKRLGR